MSHKDFPVYQPVLCIYPVVTTTRNESRHLMTKKLEYRILTNLLSDHFLQKSFFTRPYNCALPLTEQEKLDITIVQTADQFPQKPAMQNLLYTMAEDMQKINNYAMKKDIERAYRIILEEAMRCGVKMLRDIHIAEKPYEVDIYGCLTMCNGVAATVDMILGAGSGGRVRKSVMEYFGRKLQESDEILSSYERIKGLYEMGKCAPISEAIIQTATVGAEIRLQIEQQIPIYFQDEVIFSRN